MTAERDPALSPDLVTTEAAKEMLRRPQFPAFENSSGRFRRVLGGHVAVNGHDLARVEKDAHALIEEYRDALIWCSGSPSFGPDGEAREGWLRICQPLLDQEATR